MKVYKITDSKGRTRGNTQWGENVTHEVTDSGTRLCSDGWIHAYTDPLLAVLLNPVHGNLQHPLLWEAEGEGEMNTDHGMKVGFKRLTTVQQIALPQVTTEQRIRFGILCALQVYKDLGFVSWAHQWLDGSDRTSKAAARAAEAARAAAWAAQAAAWAAEAAREAWVAAWAARAAAEAALAAAWTAADIDLISLANESIKTERTI